VTGLGTYGHHAEGDEVATLGGGDTLGYGSAKSIFIRDHVVGRHHQQQWIDTLSTCCQRGQCQRRCGVAACRFEQQGGPRKAATMQLVIQQKPIALVAYDQRGSTSAAP